jgi:hypothetical protein
MAKCTTVVEYNVKCMCAATEPEFFKSPSDIITGVGNIGTGFHNIKSRSYA